jgi:hypothetical protein
VNYWTLLESSSFISYFGDPRSYADNAFKPFAALTRTPSTPRLFAHGFAIVAQAALRTKRRLTWRYAPHIIRESF